MQLIVLFSFLTSSFFDTAVIFLLNEKLLHNALSLTLNQQWMVFQKLRRAENAQSYHAPPPPLL